MSRERSLARRAQSRTGYGCLVAFFSVFLLAGLAFAVPMFLLPMARVVAATRWTPVPCRIERAEVETHDGDDGDTYSVAVRYAYEVDGKPYQGDRYRFFTGSTSGRAGKERVVSALAPGSVAECWVNPADPTDAVLDRGLGWEALLVLVPGVFVLVGGGGVFFGLRQWRRERRAAAALGAPVSSLAGIGAVGEGDPGQGLPDWLPRAPGGGSPESGPVTCPAKSSPLGRFVGLTFVALFWNGIVGVFVWQWIKGWRSGDADGCLAAFLVPFLLVGIALLLSLPHQLLALFNPRPELVLARAAVPVGGSLSFSWTFRGAASRIARLRITLHAEEVAQYRRGTDTHTDRHTFTSITLVDMPGPITYGSGHGTLSIPAGAMHSFAAANNQVNWKLELHGEIARWPDVKEEYELLVVPPGLGGRRA